MKKIAIYLLLLLWALLLKREGFHGKDENESHASCSMVAGNPAKIVGRVEEEDPSLTMKHDAAKDLFEHTIVCSARGKVNGTLRCANKC